MTLSNSIVITITSILHKSLCRVSPIKHHLGHISDTLMLHNLLYNLLLKLNDLKVKSGASTWKSWLVIYYMVTGSIHSQLRVSIHRENRSCKTIQGSLLVGVLYIRYWCDSEKHKENQNTVTG